MGLAHKLHVIGNLISDDDTIAMIKNSNFKDSEHIVLTIDFKVENLKIVDKPKISRASLDKIKTLFTKKIGGTTNSYYLYPNFEYQGEKDLYKKFKAISHTLQNSVMVYANDDNKCIATLVFEYIKNYENEVDCFIELGAVTLKGINKKITEKPTYSVTDMASLEEIVKILEER